MAVVRSGAVRLEVVGLVVILLVVAVAGVRTVVVGTEVITVTDAGRSAPELDPSKPLVWMGTLEGALYLSAVSLLR